MIEKMKKITIVALKDDQQTTLKTLRDLEVLHIQYSGEESQEFADKVREVEDLQSAIRGIAEYRQDGRDAGDFAELAPEELTAKATELLKAIGEQNEILNHLNHEIEELRPWGDFQPNNIAALRAGGIDVRLCIAKEQQMPELPQGVVRQDIANIKGNLHFAVISDKPIEDELPEIKLPEHSISQLRDQVGSAQNELSRLKAALARAAAVLPKIEEELERQAESIDFLQARDSMGSEGRLQYITGYIPKSRKGEVIQMSHRRGWALMIEDPADDDSNVPTLLRIPKWLNISKPIFDFVGISPGYREYDVSACFLIFFTIFFGMIIGDGGYGALFLAIALACKMKFRDPKAQAPINLFVVLSLATIGWGYLTGNWFGLQSGWTETGWSAQQTRLPQFLCGLKWFANQKTGQNHIQFLCFAIAVVHLSIAHGWQALASFARKKPLAGIGEIGWMCFVIGAFVVIIEMVAKVKPPAQLKSIAYVLLGVGFVLMLLFSVNWKDVGDILNFPFGALGGFVDSLSYIRLFAVGLSGYYVAVSMNALANEIMQAGGIGIVGGFVVLLFGHLLNIALCAMGVLVHGIRLNTLEFSGHLGLGWTGIKFSPFRKRPKQAN